MGYGVSATDLGHDDYADRDVTGKIVLVRRYLPAGDTFAEDRAQRRYGDLRYKAWNAREHGAAAVILVDAPEPVAGEALPEEAPLPRLRVDREGHAGLPVVTVTRAVGEPLFAGGHRAQVSVALELQSEPTHNVVGVVTAAGEPVGGPVVIGAHFDHLGMGGSGSLTPDVREPHNGADDNASGTAALLEIARLLVADREALRRDVYLVAFSGEESGLLGSTHFTKSPPAGLALEEVTAMINLDMIGRLRHNRVSVLGSASAEEWDVIVPAACDRTGLGCKLGGDGYGPSDQTPFYAAGIPVLHLFTGTHEQYHRPTDDLEQINAAGGARIAALVADLAQTLGTRESGLTHVAAAPPPPPGDSRSYGASLGTIPDYGRRQGRGVARRRSSGQRGGAGRHAPRRPPGRARRPSGR